MADITRRVYDAKRAVCSDALAKGDYSLAREIFEEELLSSSITVDGDIPDFSFDMLMDYATCLAFFGEFKVALRWVDVCEKNYDYYVKEKMEQSSNAEDTDIKREILQKFCKIYALCSKGDKLLEAMNNLNQVSGIANSFYIDIAYICSRVSLTDLAKIFVGLAQNGGELEQKDIDKISKIEKTNDAVSKKNSNIIQQSFGYFISCGQKIEPGLIIQVPHNKLDRSINPKKAKHWPNMMLFMVWKVENGLVYAFPISKFRKNKNTDQPKLELSSFPDEDKCLIASLYTIPIKPDTIPTILEKVPNENFCEIKNAMYNIVAHKSKKKPEELSKLLNLFLDEESENRPKRVGDRIIIGVEYYYISAIDNQNQEYIVIPINYDYSIRIKSYFRIPFNYEGIYRIVDTDIDDQRKVKAMLPSRNSRYINRFVTVKEKAYLVGEKLGENYVCFDIGDDTCSEDSKSCLLPVGTVDSAPCCKKEILIKYFENYPCQNKPLVKALQASSW